MPDSQTVPASPDSRPKGCLLRLFWMLVGNFMLVLTAVHIARREGGFFSLADIVFWGIVPLLIAARYFDIRHGAGETATGEPATMKHWVRYTWLLPAVSLVVWTIAHLLARFA